MPATSVFANGQTLVSSALTQNDLNQLLQTLTLGVLGIDPTADPLAYEKVRIGWVTQPGFDRASDTCAISVTEKDTAYNKIRDRAHAAHDAASVTETDTWQRTWGVSWSLYGPNSFDHARLLKTALTLDWTHDTLLASALSFEPEFMATTRAPELFQGQWWDRSDVRLSLNELVTETLIVPTIASVEIKVYDASGPIADFTLT